MPILRRREKSFVHKIILRIKLSLAGTKSWAAALIQRWSGKLRRRAVISRMRKADIVLASPRTTRLSPIALVYRLFLGSRYVHSMLYIGGGKIIHTTTRHGVVVGKVPRKIYKKDRYAIMRVKNLDAEIRDHIVKEALTRKELKLDYAGMISNVPRRLLGWRTALLRREKNRTWCSQLIYRAFRDAGIELLPGRESESITSEDLAHSPVVKKI
ncbi:MAG: hypothetical protein ACLFVG_09075 [Candidatus Aminicenantes bacterium]